MKRSLSRWLYSPVGVLALAAVLRIAFLLTRKDEPSFGDTLEYEAVALQMLGLSDGAAPPRAPAYPAFMALAFKLFGVHNYVAVRWLQLPFALALIVLVRRIGHQVGGRHVGIIAGILAAVAPTLIFTSSMLYPTTHYALCVAGATLAVLRLDAKPKLKRAIEWGAWTVLGLLLDTVILAPVGALWLWYAWRTRQRLGTLVRSMAVFTATVLLVLIPIKSVGRGSNGSSQVFIAKGQWVLHYARTDSSVGQNRWIRLPQGESNTPLPMRAFLDHEAGLLRTQPLAYVHDVAFEFAHFFAPMPDRVQTRNQYNKPWVLMLGAVYFAPVLLFALLGLWRGRAEASQRIALALVVIATAAFYSFFFTQTRYRIPVEPQLLVLAALGACAFIPRLANRETAPPSRRDA